MDHSDKQCFEMIRFKIRAFEGHSVSTKIYKMLSTPSDILYHGTAHGFLKSIKEYSHSRGFGELQLIALLYI